MTHPLVTQLRFARGEFQRCLEGVSAEDAVKRLEPMNCISWIIGHLGVQENAYWNVMAQGSVTPGAGGAFTIVYDAKTLHNDFSMLSLTAREGRWEGLADEVSINLLAVGSGAPRAATVTLIGEEIFVLSGEDPGGHQIYLPLVTRN